MQSCRRRVATGGRPPCDPPGAPPTVVNGATRLRHWWRINASRYIQARTIWIAAFCAPLWAPGLCYRAVWGVTGTVCGTVVLMLVPPMGRARRMAACYICMDEWTVLQRWSCDWWLRLADRRRGLAGFRRRHEGRRCWWADLGMCDVVLRSTQQ